MGVVRFWGWSAFDVTQGVDLKSTVGGEIGALENLSGRFLFCGNVQIVSLAALSLLPICTLRQK